MTTDSVNVTTRAIEIRDLVKSFGPTRALRDVNLTVLQGECHALLGRNGAGKSTLIAILTGLVHADSGIISVLGESSDEAEQRQAAIACVYQKSTLVEELSVAENIALGAYPETRFGSVDWKSINATAERLLDEWGHRELAGRLVATLEPIEKKIVEICRALSRGPRILLLDEPTAGLDSGGVEKLFRQVESLKRAGVTVIYVSHHLEEIFEICDRVTVLRDGRDVLDKATSELTMHSLVAAMTGSGGTTTGERALNTSSSIRADLPPRLEVSGITVESRVSDVSFDVKVGECVGITGLDGAGHVQLGQVVAGHVVPGSGKLRHNGAALPIGKPLAAIKAGIGFVPEDRHHNGYVPQMSIEENATLTILHRIRNKVGLVDGRVRRSRFNELSTSWSIACSGPTQSVEELSGGNQQKVVLARALASDPDTVVVINPTAGVDVTAKESIYESLRSLTREGRSVLVVSSDDADLAACDRVLVMYRGSIAAELDQGYAEDELVRSIQGATA
ncbi:sugar ABC transporter ATP-binding protein [Rhodococcus gannanensis]|uniref:Sugar ABC transporter ATP-binding protein n=1 Tax=Rhodococcus gannanensis TaxID=1960308 RepID=A0ABW4P095_9NOCA